MTSTQAAPPARSAPLAELPAGEVRTDIQGLRAVAVLLVLAFHLWPSILRGGYVGVDVFFVISGFLITGHLVRDAERGPRSLPRYLADFYSRRVRRLLPAAIVTTMAIWVASHFLFLGAPRLRFSRHSELRCLRNDSLHTESILCVVSGFQQT